MYGTLKPIIIILVISCLDVDVSGNYNSTVQEAHQGQFPFYVQLIFETELLSDKFYSCGGALIDDSWIVTAAHCFNIPDNTTKALIDNKRIHAFMGTNKHASYLERLSVYFLLSIIGNIVLHPNYHECYNNNQERIATQYDIALVQTKTPILLNSLIQPIKLPTSGQKMVGCKKVLVIASGGQNHETLLYTETKISKDFMNIPEWLKSSTRLYSTSHQLKDKYLFKDTGGPLVCYYGNIPVLYGVLLGNSEAIENNTAVLLTSYESTEKNLDFIYQRSRYVKQVDDNRADQVIRVNERALKETRNETSPKKTLTGGSIIAKISLFYILLLLLCHLRLQ